MITIASLLVLSRQNYNGVVTQQLNTRAYYVTMETADIAVAALLKTDETNGLRLLDEINAKTGAERYAFTKTDVINYADTNSLSRIKLAVEKDSELNEDWVVIYITTVIPDYRVNVGDVNDADKKYTYEMYYEMKILISDPSVRAFDAITSDMVG